MKKKIQKKKETEKTSSKDKKEQLSSKSSKKKPCIDKKKAKVPSDISKVLRRKKILCQTCAHAERCADAINKQYPLICMLYLMR